MTLADETGTQALGGDLPVVCGEGGFPGGAVEAWLGPLTWGFPVPAEDAGDGKGLVEAGVEVAMAVTESEPGWQDLSRTTP